MSFLKQSLFALLVIPAALTIGCTQATQDSESSTEGSTAESTLTGPSTYYYLTNWDDTGASLSLVNQKSAAVRVAKADLALAPACANNWECQEAGADSRGSMIVRGTLSKKQVSGKTVYSFAGAADLLGKAISSPSTAVVYRLYRENRMCTKAPCANPIFAAKLNNTTVSQITEVKLDQKVYAPTAQYPDTKSQDAWLSEQIGGYYDDLSGTEGILATGTIKNGVFTATDIWNAWPDERHYCYSFTTAWEYYQQSYTSTSVTFTRTFQSLTAALANKETYGSNYELRWVALGTDNGFSREYSFGRNDKSVAKIRVDRGNDGTCSIVKLTN